MRPFFLFVILLTCGGAALFYKNSNVREKVRGIQVAEEDRERHDNYLTGKALFKSKWTGAATAIFAAWGDEPSETSAVVPGTAYWVARGHFTTATDSIPQQWCMTFDPKTGAAMGVPGVGKSAEQALAILDAKKSGTGPAAPAPGAIMPGAVETPAPAGNWMWSKKGRGSLDQPAHK